MFKALQKIAALVLGIPRIKALLEKIIVALGVAGFVDAIIRFLDPATAKIMDGQKAIQQAIETGFESLKTTLGSVAEFLSGNPAAREKVDRLDEIAEKRKRLAELNAESEVSDASGPRDISAQVGLAGEIGALEQEAAADLLEPTSARQGLAEFCEAFDAKMTDLLSAIDDMAVRSAAAMEALVGKEAAAVRETPRAADDLIVPDGRLITGSLFPGAAGGGISILESAGQAFDALDATLEKVDKSMSNVFANMTEGGASAADALSQIFARLDTDILGSLGKFGSLFSQLFGGGPASVLGSILGFAGGGAVQPGAPILVGERGPEIFLPSGPGRVLNAHNTARAMGGAGAGGQRPLVVQQTINFSTDVKNTVRAEVLNALPLATNIAAQQVADMLRGIRR